MDFDVLEREGLVAKLKVDKRKVRDSFGLAERDLKTAKKIMEEDLDWAYSIAYNAMLQAARSLMFSHGFRPIGKIQHVSAVRFAEAALGNEHEAVIVAFDRMRRKRHVIVYDSAGSISFTAARNAVDRAEEFLKEIKEILRSRGFL